MRRAKEFSEELRKTCREIQSKNYLLVCSNQVRQKHDASKYESKYISPGGEGIGFYSSLRLRCMSPKKIQQEKIVAGKKVKKVVGVTTEIEVFKSSVWKPYGHAPLTILFGYGTDDVRQNLQFLKNFTDATKYTVGGKELAVSMEESIGIVEREGLIADLKEEVIDLWEGIDRKFKQYRQKKVR